MSWPGNALKGAVLAALFATSTLWADPVETLDCKTGSSGVARRRVSAYRNTMLDKALVEFANRSLKPKTVNHVVDLFSHQGIVAMHLPHEMIPRVAVDPERAMTRYGHGPETKNQTVFGKEGEPGATLIHAPAERVGLDDPSRFHVPPHVHPSNHFSIVLEGHGRFIAYRNGEWLSFDVMPGTILFIPKEMPHTFWAGGGIDVLAVAEEFHSADAPEYGRRSSVAYAPGRKLTPKYY